MENSQVTITLTSHDRSEVPSVRQFTLTPTSRSIDIGRSSGSRSKGITAAGDNAWFNNPVMSRRHGTLFIKPDSRHLYMRDLGSMHGTSLNGKIVQLNKEYKIENRDVVKFGNHIVRGEESFPARAYEIRYNWTPIIKRTGTSTFTVPDGNSSSDVDSISESSEDDQSRDAKAPTSVSIRGLLANRKLKMGSRVASVVGPDALHPPQNTKSGESTWTPKAFELETTIMLTENAVSEAGSSQQNPVELDEDDANYARPPSAPKVTPDSVIDIINETGDSTRRQIATASSEDRPESQPLTLDAAISASEPEPAIKSKITDGNANAEREQWSLRESTPDIRKDSYTYTIPVYEPKSPDYEPKSPDFHMESSTIQVYKPASPDFHPSEEESRLDGNEKYKEFEQAFRSKDFHDELFALGRELVNGKQGQDKPSFSDAFPRSYNREASLERVAQDVREVAFKHNETNGNPKHVCPTVPSGSLPDSMQQNPATSQADRVSKGGSSLNTTAASVQSTQGYRAEPKRRGHQRDCPKYQSVTFAEEPIIHEPRSFGPPRPWDMDYGLTEAPWSANLSSNYWDPVRGLHCEEWNPVVTHSQSSSSRPLHGYGSQFVHSSAPYNTSAEPPYFLPTSKLKWGTDATYTEGFAPSVFKASQDAHDTVDDAGPSRLKHPNTQQATRKSPMFRSPRKKGMSILDILDPNASKPMASAAGTKRKLAEMTTAPALVDPAWDEDIVGAITAPCAEASSDNQHQEPLVMPEPTIDTAASAASTHDVQEPVRKRGRWQFAAAAATGALVGSLGMLATLVSLPDSLFQ